MINRFQQAMTIVTLIQAVDMLILMGVLVFVLDLGLQIQIIIINNASINKEVKES
jgi:hypothetical protein